METSKEANQDLLSKLEGLIVDLETRTDHSARSELLLHQDRRACTMRRLELIADEREEHSGRMSVLNNEQEYHAMRMKLMEMEIEYRALSTAKLRDEESS